MSFLYHRLPGRPARLPERREVTAYTQLRDVQADGPRPGIPTARPVAVPLGLTLRAALAMPGPADSGHLILPAINSPD